MQIRIMDEGLANRIAAGEVVERPASVVKELVENSLDAGATSVEVEIERGGRRLLRVSDDGAGMVRDDLLLCLERFATSKLVVLEDLEAIGTYGFRGEALPSIAAVSRLSLTSRPADALEGWRVQVAGGEVRDVSAVGCAPGTVVEVRDLFFNTPARRKFLKSEVTETGHVADALLRLALARPEIHVRLARDGRTRFDRPAGEAWTARAAALLGRDLRGRLYPLAGSRGALHISGLFGAPDVARRGAARALYLFVNGRPVRDRGLIHAVLSAYGDLVPKGRTPVVVLRLELPPGEVDVNVHPTKHEVRFRRAGEVHDAVHSAIAAALAPSPWLDGLALSGGVRYDRRTGEVVADPGSGGVAAAPVDGRVAGAVARAIDAETRSDRRWSSSTVAERVSLWSSPGREALGAVDEVRGRTTGRFGTLRYIGSLGGTYLLCEGPDGLVVLDQHAAHERVTFERLKRQRAAAGVASQGLLVPVRLELGSSEAERSGELAAALSALGFEAEPFGGRSLAVKAVPALLAEAAIERLVRDVLDELAERGGAEAADRATEALLSRMACHASVRAGDPLGASEVRALLAALDGTDLAAACPHGRPVVVELNFRELERMFRRS